MGDPIRIALIGFGHVGTTFSPGLIAAGYELTAYDVLIHDPVARKSLIEKAEAIGVRLRESAAEAAEGAKIVISAVTSASASDVARSAAAYLKPGQFFLDVNSGSPRTKRSDSKAVAASGADYVEAAMIVPIGPHGLKVPIVLGGARSAEVKALLDPAGMRLEIGEPEVGKASAIKICRSVMIKGLEALTVECFGIARLYGVEREIMATLSESYPTVDWEEFAGYRIGRAVEHGRRRAAEMREVSETVVETGLAPLMSRGAAERMEWVADRVARRPEMKKLKDSEWREMLDIMAEDAKLRRLDDV